MGSAGPCHRCGRSGHLARDCNLHTCFRCNGRGHMAWECVEGVTCSRCGEKGHLQRNCKSVSCHKCKKKGHIAKFCNDPFAKAADAEMKERQLAGFLTRQSGLQTTVSEDQGGVSNKELLGRVSAPSAWDGLGVLKSGASMREKARHESEGPSAKGMRSETAIRILGLKRKKSSSVENARVLKPKHSQEMGRAGGFLRETLEPGAVARHGPNDTADPVEDREGQSWLGLVGYGSEESDLELDNSMSCLPREGEHDRNEIHGESATSLKPIVCPAVNANHHGPVDAKEKPLTDSINDVVIVRYDSGSTADVCPLFCANDVSQRCGNC